MSYLDVYVGYLDDSTFSWDGGDWSGNVPKRRSPFLPDGYRVFRVVLERINSGEWVGKQTDWGGWVARLSPSEIEQFIDEIYGPPNDDAALFPGSPHLLVDLRDLRQFVKELRRDELYALVATEL